MLCSTWLQTLRSDPASLPLSGVRVRAHPIEPPLHTLPPVPVEVLAAAARSAAAQTLVAGTLAPVTTVPPYAQLVRQLQSLHKQTKQAASRGAQENPQQARGARFMRARALARACISRHSSGEDWQHVGLHEGSLPAILPLRHAKRAVAGAPRVYPGLDGVRACPCRVC